MAKKEPGAVQTAQPCLSLLPRLLEGKIGFDFFVQPASRQALERKLRFWLTCSGICSATSGPERCAFSSL